MNANGNEELPVYRKRMIEAANEAYQEVANERDDLERRLREMTLKYEGEVMKLEHMDGVINLMESTLKTQQLRCDATVARAAGLQATIDNIASILWDTASDKVKQTLGPEEAYPSD